VKNRLFKLGENMAQKGKASRKRWIDWIFQGRLGRVEASSLANPLSNLGNDSGGTYLHLYVCRSDFIT